MKKISLILMVVLIVTTGCSVKEGFTTFGALENKIDDYLINVDISDAKEKMVQADSLELGNGLIEVYLIEDKIVYIKTTLQKDDYINSYEIFYIDASLIHVIEIIQEVEKVEEIDQIDINEIEVVSETFTEYIILDDELAIFDREDAVLGDLNKDNNLKSLITYIQNSIKQ